MQAQMMETLDACPVCGGKRIGCEHAELELWHCADCGVFFNSPRPTKTFIEKNYNEGDHYARFTPDEKWNAFWARRMDRVLKHKPRGPILDISAGIGTAVKQLRDRGFECNGSEISKEAIARARELYGLELMEGYPEELPLRSGTLGCLMMWHVFEHLPFPGSSLMHLADKIASGGLLVIAVPNSSFSRLARHAKLWLAPRRAKLEALFSKIDYNVKFQEIHLIHFTPASLRRIVEAAGFKVLEQGVDNVLSKWRDAKLPLRNLAARLGFNDAPAMVLIAQKAGPPSRLRA